MEETAEAAAAEATVYQQKRTFLGELCALEKRYGTVDRRKWRSITTSQATNPPCAPRSSLPSSFTAASVPLDVRRSRCNRTSRLCRASYVRWSDHHRRCRIALHVSPRRTVVHSKESPESLSAIATSVVATLAPRQADNRLPKFVVARQQW
jgi:hypothetical protein